MIGEAMKYVAKEKIVPCTNCGMAPMRREIANAKLEGARQGRGAGAEEVRLTHTLQPSLEKGRSACEASRVGIIFGVCPPPRPSPFQGDGSAAERVARE